MLLDDLRAEHDVLDDLLAAQPVSALATPTPAIGWTVGDVLRHLVAAERAAAVSIRDGRDFRDASSSRAERTDHAPIDDRHALDAWRAARADTLDAFGAVDARARVPWGGREMSARSLATARLMETWAHGLDCFAALGVEPVDTDRLVHVAWLGWRTLPHAFAIAGVAPPAPPDRLRVELRAPSGDTWRFGPSGDDVPQHLVRGPASTWCRVVTRRLRGRPLDLEAHGPLAEAAVQHAQAYLDA